MPTFIAQNQQQLGPFEDSEILAGIAQGRFAISDLAWRDGLPNWLPLRELYPQVIPANMPPLPRAKDMGDDAGIRMLLPVGRSGWAIAAGYMGLFSVLLFPAPLALIFGILAIRNIRRSRNDAHPKHGLGRAWFGVIMGALGTLALIAIAVSSMVK